MLAIKLALRNLLGAGLRTWLNVFVLSLSYVLIIYMNGMLDGWNSQAKGDMKVWETGSSQYWHNKYDPFDDFSIEESHARRFVACGEVVTRHRGVHSDLIAATDQLFDL